MTTDLYNKANAFINNATSRSFNYGYGNQCVALIQGYCDALFGNWINTLGYGNACDLYAGASEDYFDKIPNDPNDPNQNPQRCDIVCVNAYHNAQMYSDYGHIFICTGNASSDGIPSIEQDGYHQWKGCYQVLNDWNEFTQYDGSNAVIGWLRPKGFEDSQQNFDFFDIGLVVDSLYNVGQVVDHGGNKSDDDVEAFKRVAIQDGMEMSEGPVFTEHDTFLICLGAIRTSNTIPAFVEWLANSRWADLNIRGR